MNPRISILICIDIEPDERAIDPRVRADWTGFEKSYEFFSELRPRLEVATDSPVHFSWFLRMDPQVAHTYGSPDWVATRYPRLIEELEAAGDELGIHTHAWRWDEHSEEWISDFGDQKWVDHCVRSSFEAFHTSLNRQCRSFRFGDRWMNDQTLDLLEKLGTRYDLTLEPGQSGSSYPPGEHFTGSFPDYTLIPQAPYRPHKTDFTKRGLVRKRDLWMIPVSAGSVEWPPVSPVLREAALPKPWRDAHQRQITLNLAFNQMVLSRIADGLLGVLEQPYLALVARTDNAVDPDQRSNPQDNIGYLLSHPLVERFAFETPGEAMSRRRFDPLKWWKTRNH